MRQVMTATAVALALSFSAPVLAQQAGQGQMKMSSDADHLIGKKAMGSQGKEVGEIEDVLVGKDGKVQAMIVDYKGKKRAVPWEQAQMQGDEVTIGMSEQQMSELPEYKAKD